MSLLEGIDKDEAVVVVSALLPNRRSQPLFHEWFAVRFVDGQRKNILPFARWAEGAIGHRAHPNRNAPVDVGPLRSLVAPAVEGARSATLARWKEREAELAAKLERELTRLRALRNRRFDQLVFDFGRRDRSEINAEVDKVFAPFLRFVEESMTAGKEPFIEVLAVFRHEAGFRPRAGSAS